MPMLDAENHTFGAGGNFAFTGARIENLSATDYTLATVAVDLTGSTYLFASELHAMLLLAVDGCHKSPRSDNLLLRVITFNDAEGVKELHGFTPLKDIVAADYPAFDPGGLTNLYDATYSAVGATNAYAQSLVDQDFGVNAVTFIITDGMDNRSTVTPAMIKAEIAKSMTGEALESHNTILIGINVLDSNVADALTTFRTAAGITEYVDAGEATKGKLAKLAAFVSQSVSSTSQSLGTGAAAPISASI